MNRTIRWSTSAVALLALVLSPAILAAGGPEPAGYRMENYRAPVPDTLKGATVIDTGEAERLWRAMEAGFIDVLPRPPKPKLPEGTLYREKPRHNIPGSLWLADVGYGALPPEMDGYFRDGLARASRGDTSAKLVIYCLADCWMSWNAAKRAIAYGYRVVYWYPAGMDGWTASGLPVELSRPLPRPGEAP